MKSTVSPVPEAPDDLEELPRAHVALLLGEVVAEGTLFVGVAAGDDVQQEPPMRVPLEGRRHLRGEGRRDEAGTEGDQELQPLGGLGQHRGDHPGVVAPAAGRGQGRLEAEVLGGGRDPGQVGDRGLAEATGDARRGSVAGLDQAAAVALRRQEPVEAQVGDYATTTGARPRSASRARTIGNTSRPK